MNKDVVICLIGESGSGKSTIANMLGDRGYNVIDSYTTRTPRYEGEGGHIYIKDKHIGELAAQDKLGGGNFEVMAYTYFDNEHYWVVRGQYLNKGISIYVVDVAGYQQLKLKEHEVKLVAIYLKTDANTRVGRMMNRGDYKDKIAQRIQHDYEIFSVVPCDYAVDANGELDEVFSKIMKIVAVKSV
jgi:guanylate kinase